MKRSPIRVLTAAIVVQLVAGQAYAFTVTNRDLSEHSLQITEGGDEAVTRDVVIAPDQTVDDLCEDGCTIVLDNGEQQSFEGYEEVYIEGGRFVIAK